MDEQLTILMNSTIDELAYWKQRCLAAERVIVFSREYDEIGFDCSNDVVQHSLAKEEWQSLVKGQK